MRCRHLFLLLPLILASCGWQKSLQVSVADEQQLVRDEATAASINAQAPLTTSYESPQAFASHAIAIELCVEIPKNISAAIGCGIYLSDDEGNWLCQSAQQAIGPGLHHLEFHLDRQHDWIAPASSMLLDAYALELIKRFGCFFWTEEESSVVYQVHACRLIFPQEKTQHKQYALHDLQLDGMSDQYARVQTGERWQLQFNPYPFPKAPYQTSSFKADLLLRAEDGTELSIPSFYLEPMALQNVGSYEDAQRVDDARFCVRYRPLQAGRYQLQLRCVWNGTEERLYALPDLQVTGEAWDEFVRSDKNDKRFLQVDGKFFWPTGMNLKSANDDWGQRYLRTRLTPSLGTDTYEKYLKRLSLAGGNVTELWMSNWNLCLEWYDGWESYHGLKGYSAKHAQQLDDILDCAYEHGIRVILSFRNHGQAHTRSGNPNIPSDTNEWHFNPYNKQVGGFLNSAVDLFIDPMAHQRQKDLHRYICARYADHPAILMWKLWSEVDLTDAAKHDSHKLFKPTEALGNWHRIMSKHLSDLDIYDHLMCSHFSTDFHRIDSTVFKIPEITAICMNAYLWRLEGAFGRQYTLAQLLYDSVHERGAFKIHTDILGELNKPIMVTEFGGGNPYRMTSRQLEAHHLCAPWAALMSGHAIAPLFWWYEWVDQGEYWHAFSAVKSFIADEDLRGAKARSAILKTEHKDYRLWTRAWVRPGKILAYVIEQRWAESGRVSAAIKGAKMSIGTKVKAGEMQLEIWDANLGKIIQQKIVKHPGGPLSVELPNFRRHLALKLYRLD